MTRPTDPGDLRLRAARMGHHRLLFGILRSAPEGRDSGAVFAQWVTEEIPVGRRASVWEGVMAGEAPAPEIILAIPDVGIRFVLNAISHAQDV